MWEDLQENFQKRYYKNMWSEKSDKTDRRMRKGKF